MLRMKLSRTHSGGRPDLCDNLSQKPLRPLAGRGIRRVAAVSPTDISRQQLRGVSCQLPAQPAAPSRARRRAGDRGGAAGRAARPSERALWTMRGCVSASEWP